MRAECNESTGAASARRVRFDIVPEVRRVANSQAALSWAFDGGPGLLDEPGSLGAGIDEEANRVVIETNTFDQDLRHRLAKRYGLDLL
ncbi:hypothetical protein [Streptosporangium sp. KLBMP 9127]|nr:hypothetical protein [Streptosporangium sp. KLBMP 9127]